jgi:hypothetical protein
MSCQKKVYVTTSIPYVNSRPHVGHALELIQADVIARHYRLAGHDVRFQTGTDENAFKNFVGAEAEGRDIERPGTGMPQPPDRSDGREILRSSKPLLMKFSTSFLRSTGTIGISSLPMRSSSVV